MPDLPATPPDVSGTTVAPLAERLTAGQLAEVAAMVKDGLASGMPSGQAQALGEMMMLGYAEQNGPT